MSDPPLWASLLQHMYENQKRELDVHTDTGGEASIPNGSSFPEDIGIERDQLEKSLNYMMQAGLVGADHQGGKIRLTPYGFKVAHQRIMDSQQEEREDRRAKLQDRTNRAIAIATIGLMIATVSTGAASVYSGAVIYSLAVELFWVGAVVVTVLILYLFWMIFFQGPEIES